MARESIGDSVAILDARIKAGMITGASAPIRVAPKIPESCGSEADQKAEAVEEVEEAQDDDEE